MLPQKTVRPGGDGFGLPSPARPKVEVPESRLESRSARSSRIPHFAQIVRVELVGDRRAQGFGFAVEGYAPLCALCRQLIRGLDPDRPVEAYRGGVLALRAPSLAVAAGITVEDGPDGRPRFKRHRPRSWGFMIA